MVGPRRVVVTGMGLVSAIGLDEKTAWSRLLEGRTGLAPLSGFDLSGNDVQNGAQVDTTELDLFQKGKLRRADRTLRFAVEASRQALLAAGRLSDPPREPQEIGTIWGTAYGPAQTLWGIQKRFAERGPKGMRPSTVPSGMANAISAGVSLEFQLVGTNQVVVSACTSSTNAIGHGFRMVRDGYSDAVLCGGAEASFDPFNYGVWNNLGVFSKISDPEAAVRPFAADRAGTLIGEGAGALLLESLEHAERRGVRIRGEIVGYGESADATHITRPSVAGQAAAIRAALEVAQTGPHAIGFINAHGTATETNDATESLSIREALGSDADRIPVGASKSFLGHTLGASGILESVITLLGLEEGIVPPNLNLERPDPECPIRLVGGKPEELDAELAMKNSFGFGGGNGVLIYRRFSGGATV